MPTLARGHWVRCSCYGCEAVLNIAWHVPRTLRIRAHSSRRLMIYSAGKAGAGQAATPSLIPLSRANNVSIMLTQFSNLRDPVQEIKAGILSGKVGVERLSLLLQVSVLAVMAAFRPGGHVMYVTCMSRVCS